MMTTRPSINIPESAWEAIGDPPHERDRLVTTIELNGELFHAEAFAVTCGSDGQEASDPECERDFSDFYAAAHAEGPLGTLRIGDREYAVFAYSFCE